MTTLAAPKVALKLTPVPKTVLYAGLAGELLKNTGMKDDDQIRSVQQAVSEGLVDKVIVIAKHPDGRKERFELGIKPFNGADTIDLHLEPGKSYLEALDVSLAAGVQYAADLITRRGLTPTFHVAWSSRAKANPDIVKEAIKRLNLKVESEEPLKPAPVYTPPTPSYTYTPPTPPQRYPQAVHTYYTPPPPPPNHQWWTVVKVTPEKDPGITFSISTTRPKKELMSLFDAFRRKPTPPPVAPQPVAIKLKRAPTCQPLPVTPTDSLDAQIRSLWLDFQRIKPQATWPAFLDSLRTTNANLESEIVATKRSLEKSGPPSDFVP